MYTRVYNMPQNLSNPLKPSEEALSLMIEQHDSFILIVKVHAYSFKTSGRDP